MQSMLNCMSGVPYHPSAQRLTSRSTELSARVLSPVCRPLGRPLRRRRNENCLLRSAARASRTTEPNPAHDEDHAALHSLRNVLLDDIGVGAHELSRDIGIVDSAETLALSKEFSIPGCVRVSDGRGGMPKVTLIHHSGSFCEVYLDGGNIHTWVLANGGEVFYSPDGVPLNQHTLNDWGTSICFPQFGKGGERPGTPKSDQPLPMDGLAKTLKWTISQTGVNDNGTGEFPYVTIEVSDTESSRALWNKSFQLSMEVSLQHDALEISVCVKNTGTERLEFATALKSHLAVSDIEAPQTKFIGMKNYVYLDNVRHATKPRVRYNDALDGIDADQLSGATDRVYLNTKSETGVEVGTGCTVLVRDISAADEHGYNDRAVFNKWKENDAENYRWYAGLAIGAIGKLIKVDPGLIHTASVRFEVHDLSYTTDSMHRKSKHQRSSLQEMTNRTSFALLDSNVSGDFQ